MRRTSHWEEDVVIQPFFFSSLSFLKWGSEPQVHNRELNHSFAFARNLFLHLSFSGFVPLSFASEYNNILWDFSLLPKWSGNRRITPPTLSLSLVTLATEDGERERSYNNVIIKNIDELLSLDTSYFSCFGCIILPLQSKVWIHASPLHIRRLITRFDF